MRAPLCRRPADLPAAAHSVPPARPRRRSRSATASVTSFLIAVYAPASRRSTHWDNVRSACATMVAPRSASISIIPAQSFQKCSLRYFWPPSQRMVTIDAGLALHQITLRPRGLQQRHWRRRKCRPAGLLPGPAGGPSRRRLRFRSRDYRRQDSDRRCAGLIAVGMCFGAFQPMQRRRRLNGNAAHLGHISLADAA